MKRGEYKNQQRLASSSTIMDECDIWARLKQLSNRTGYPIFNLKYSRKVGPKQEARNPEHGSEIYVRHLPTDALEDELFYFFNQVGEIYDIRLMVTPSGIANRGFAFVKYCTPEQADDAITKLSKIEFRPNHKIILEKSFEKNILFVEKIPKHQTKEQIWEELLNAGFRNIVNVIVHKHHKTNLKNRGFIFVEFGTHEDAATMFKTFKENLKLWNQRVHISWAKPLKEIDPEEMCKVRRLFLRNLDSKMTKCQFRKILKAASLNMDTIEKVYKNFNYAFVHFDTRQMAETAFELLKEYFNATDIEVAWAKPTEHSSHVDRESSPPIKLPITVEGAWSPIPDLKQDQYIDQKPYPSVLPNHDEGTWSFARDLHQMDGKSFLPSIERGWQLWNNHFDGGLNTVRLNKDTY